MTQTDQPTTEQATPTCYRHHDRETLVSCGRCEKPLCPDCVQYGPVGIRCWDCLHPQGTFGGQTAPTNVKLAIGVALGQAVLWIILLLLSEFLNLSTAAPNLLLAGVAGGVIGWSMWRICGRTWSQKTAWWAFGIGLAMPLIASLPILVLMLFSQSAEMLIWGVRVLASMLISGFFAWLLVTRRR
ncbi:MAG: hypothetical protein ACYDBB_15805 [Armatimonadota bacterium]